jgi:hypothetical protein
VPDAVRGLPGVSRYAAPPPTTGLTWLSAESRARMDGASDPHAWRALEGPRWWADAAFHLTVRIHALGMPDDLRRSGDAAGLRASMPLLDQDLVELALRMPPELGFGPQLGKPLLRGALAGLVPDPVRLRPVKTVFNELMVAAVTGPDGPVMRRLLLDPAAESRRVTPGGVPGGGLFDDPPAPGTTASWYWAQDLWRLTMLECWLREQADPGFAARTIEAGLPERRFRFLSISRREGRDTSGIAL